MFSEFRRLCLFYCPVFWFLLRCCPRSSRTPAPHGSLNARTVFVSNGGGDNYFEIFSGGANRAYNTFYKMLKRTGHYELASSPAEADLIFEVRAIRRQLPGRKTSFPTIRRSSTIRDPRTNAVLWTESANVRAIGTKGRRDRQSTSRSRYLWTSWHW